MYQHQSIMRFASQVEYTICVSQIFHTLKTNSKPVCYRSQRLDVNHIGAIYILHYIKLSNLKIFSTIKLHIYITTFNLRHLRAVRSLAYLRSDILSWRFFFLFLSSQIISASNRMMDDNCECIRWLDQLNLYFFVSTVREKKNFARYAIFSHAYCTIPNKSRPRANFRRVSSSAIRSRNIYRETPATLSFNLFSPLFIATIWLETRKRTTSGEGVSISSACRTFFLATILGDENSISL